MQWTCHSVQWPQECPPNTTAGPLPVANWRLGGDLATDLANWPAPDLAQLHGDFHKLTEAAPLIG